jgi:hypothetical protein
MPFVVEVGYSTGFARLRGWSTSVPLSTATSRGEPAQAAREAGMSMYPQSLAGFIAARYKQHPATWVLLDVVESSITGKGRHDREIA